MNRSILVTLVAFGSLGTGRAEDAALVFSPQTIEFPARSLPELAQQELKFRWPDLAPRSRAIFCWPQLRSSRIATIPIKKPNETFDVKITVKAPDSSTDYKLRTMNPEAEPPK
jgi:hypothetical protein